MTSQAGIYMTKDLLSWQYEHWVCHRKWRASWLLERKALAIWDVAGSCIKKLWQKTWYIFLFYSAIDNVLIIWSRYIKINHIPVILPLMSLDMLRPNMVSVKYVTKTFFFYIYDSGKLVPKSGILPVILHILILITISLGLSNFSWQ